MIRPALLLSLLLSAGSAAYGQCSAKLSEPEQARRAVHGTVLLTGREATAIVDAWVPKAVAELRTGVASRDWHKLGIALGVALNRLERQQEAEEVLKLVAESPGAGRLARVANRLMEPNPQQSQQ